MKPAGGKQCWADHHCPESGASPQKKLKIHFSVLFGSPLETNAPKTTRDLAMQNAALQESEVPLPVLKHRNLKPPSY